MRRIGSEGTSLTVKQIITIVSFIIIVAAFAAFFANVLTGCWADEGCRKASESLDSLVEDVNEACRDSTLETSSSFAQLGDYDFNGAHYLKIREDNLFIVGRYNTPDIDPLETASELQDLVVNQEVETMDWELDARADECDTVRKDNPPQTWIPVEIGSQLDPSFQYQTPEERRIILRKN